MARYLNRVIARSVRPRAVAGLVAIAMLLLCAGAVSADTTASQTSATTANQTTVIIPGYCYNAPVTMTTDQSGNATYTCTATGQTIYPFAGGYGGYGYSGYGYGYGYGAGWVPPGTYNGISCGGVYGCPLGISPYYGGTYVTSSVICGLYACGLVEPIKR